MHVFANGNAFPQIVIPARPRQGLMPPRRNFDRKEGKVLRAQVKNFAWLYIMGMARVYYVVRTDAFKSRDESIAR